MYYRVFYNKPRAYLLLERYQFRIQQLFVLKLFLSHKPAPWKL